MELPIPTPSDIAEGISKHGLHYIIGVLCGVVGALFWKMMSIQGERISDKDAFQAQITALAKESAASVAENGRQTVLSTHVLTELRGALTEVRGEIAELRRAVAERNQPRHPRARHGEKPPETT